MRICTSINTLSQASVGTISSRVWIGRFTRRVRGSASGARHRVIGCGAAERRHGITEEHLRAPRGMGAMGDPGAPGADDGVAGESVQCRPGHSPVRAVDVCTVTPQASRCGGWRRPVHTCAPPGCWGSSPEVVTRLAGTLDRIAARRRAQPATDTFRRSAPPVSAGSMPTVTVSALPSGYDAASSAIQAAGGAVHRDGATSAADGSAPGTAVTPSPPQPLGWLRPWS